MAYKYSKTISLLIGISILDNDLSSLKKRNNIILIYMNETVAYKRSPAVRCWIRNLLDGKPVENQNLLYTIFGEIRRTRLVGTIIDKREILSTQLENENDFLEDPDGTKVRLEFDFDDGTGMIRLNIWEANPEDFEHINRGDLVKVVGLINLWKGFRSVNAEIVKKIDNPNYLLLNDAEIIKKIKFGETEEIPETSEDNLDLDEIPDDFNIDELFSEDEKEEKNTPKEKIYKIIEEHTLEGKGISFDDLLSKVKFSEEKVKHLIRDLEIESRIYQSDKNIYQTYY
ncbi:MAG: hypothetical protein GF353_18210 [Candidatus Lokiarchaeota archaeon]|nr:hypothetical protein [Candidatus Lokiarchaeota archaeon]